MKIFATFFIRCNFRKYAPHFFISSVFKININEDICPSFKTSFWTLQYLPIPILASNPNSNILLMDTWGKDAMTQVVIPVTHVCTRPGLSSSSHL